MEENFTAKKQLKDNYGFTDNDFEQIKSHGIALDKIVEQLRIFEDGIPKIILDRPAKIDDGILKLSKEEFQKLGYKTKWDVLTASDYGVPQNRNRFFMIGNRLDIDFVFPEKQEKKITVNEAIEDLPKLNNGDSFEILNYKKIKVFVVY